MPPSTRVLSSNALTKRIQVRISEKNQSIKVKEYKLESEAGYFSFQGQTFVSTQQAVSEKFLMLANFVDWSQPQGVQRTASKLF